MIPKFLLHYYRLRLLLLLSSVSSLYLSLQPSLPDNVAKIIRFIVAASFEIKIQRAPQQRLKVKEPKLCHISRNLSYHHNK